MAKQKENDDRIKQMLKKVEELEQNGLFATIRRESKQIT